MYIKYGSYQFPDEEAAFTLQKRRLRTARNTPGPLVVTATISGTILSSSQDNMSTAIQDLVEAFEVEGRDCGLYQDDDTPTPLFLDSSASRSGVRILEAPSFPNGNQVYATNWDYRIVLEAEFDDETDDLVDFREQVQTIGNGGPAKFPVRLQSGPPEIQTPHLRTECYAIQTGHTVGYRSYPPIPLPIWPALEDGSRRRLTFEGPQRNGDAFENFGRTWTYYFIGKVPFFGTPTFR